ncbi:hypothetical protein [Nonomuraea sediminis]|uniref:hypothetical protein n=1 Tax=Nonomuraea sediminis TaxID=2835864 RepID=UPI001BDBD972|nr:hypothetical protein [Nonomuraea sediminis]
MNPQDAQSALDNVRRLEGKTREEMVRKILPLPHVVISALGIFVGLASTDLERPWSTIAFVLGFFMFAGVGMVYAHWTAVHRKPTNQEIGVRVALIVVLYVVFVVARIAAFGLIHAPASGLLSQGGIAAAVTAVAYLGLTPLIRRIMKTIILREAGQADGPSVR